MGPWSQSLLSVALVSAIPLAGLLAARGGEKRVERLVPYLVSFAVGTMLGTALFHLVPEAVARLGSGPRFSTLFLAGFVGFFFLERSLWLHEHEPPPGAGPRRHPVVLLNLVGDGVHNLASALTAGLGAVVALLAGQRVAGSAAALLPFAAGSFLYVAGSDLIPELQRERRVATSVRQAVLILLGVALMAVLAGMER